MLDYTCISLNLLSSNSFHLGHISNKCPHLAFFRLQTMYFSLSKVGSWNPSKIYFQYHNNCLCSNCCTPLEFHKTSRFQFLNSRRDARKFWHYSIRMQLLVINDWLIHRYTQRTSCIWRLHLFTVAQALSVTATVHAVGFIANLLMRARTEVHASYSCTRQEDSSCCF